MDVNLFLKKLHAYETHVSQWPVDAEYLERKRYWNRAVVQAGELAGFLWMLTIPDAEKSQYQAKIQRLNEQVEQNAAKLLAQAPNLELMSDSFFKTTLQLPDCVEMNFSDKSNGSQWGKLLKFIDPKNGALHYYHIKTHQYGMHCTSVSSVTGREVDLKELLTYKLLEHLDIGPPAYFFCDPKVRFGVYIATFDLNVLNPAGFNTFKELKTKNPFFISNYRHKTQLLKELCRLKWLSAVLLLADLTTNSGNFGWVGIDSDSPRLKIVDFRTQDNFPKFISGEALLQQFSQTSDELSGGFFEKDYAFLETAQLLTSEFSGLPSAVALALQDTLNFVQKNGWVTQNTEVQQLDLKSYTDFILANYKNFSEHLENLKGNAPKKGL